MQIAVYVIYELLLRLKKLNPDVGDYIHNKITTTGINVRTSTGQIAMPEGILVRQFNNPDSITTNELLDLLDSFEIIGRV